MTGRMTGGFSKLLPALLAVGIVGAANLGHAADPNTICPATLAGQFNRSPYQFNFGSWSSETAPFSISHCLRNEGDRVLWFQWERTGLQAFARRGSPVYARQSYGTADFVRNDANLWYGPQPEQLQTQIVEPRGETKLASSIMSDGQVVVPTERTLAKAWLPYRKGEDNLRSIADGGALDDPSSTQTIEVRFESVFRPDKKEVAYSLTLAAPHDSTFFKDSAERNRGFLWVGVEDPVLQDQLFGVPRAVSLRSFARRSMDRDPNGNAVIRYVPPILSNDQETATLIATSPVYAGPRLIHSRLVVYGPDSETPLASLPIAFASVFERPTDNPAVNFTVAQLKTIQEMATSICGHFDVAGSARSFSLDGSAKAELNSTFKKLNDLGVKGAGKFTADEYSGILRTELATEIRDTRECRARVLKDLLDRFSSGQTRTPN